MKIAFALAALLMFGGSFACPTHSNSQCYGTGQTKYTPEGKPLAEYRCNPCGDVYWVAQ